MNSIHFRRWSEQLRDSGHELYWFDILDQGYAPSMDYMTQITGWKKGFLKKRGRTFIKNKLPRLYNALVHKYDTPVDIAFAKAVQEIQPDVVHSFALQISCLPIYEVMMQQVNLKWLYSSWGTDLFLPQTLGISMDRVHCVLTRLDFLMTDCYRDYKIAVNMGFKGVFLGVFPGNGGTDFKPQQPFLKESSGILIKAYEDDYGRGDMIAQAILNLKVVLQETTVYFIGASQNPIYKELESWKNVTVFPRHKMLTQEQLFSIYENCFIYCAFSISDGLPNMLIEAMGHGLFPIQSNPGNVMLEIIEDEISGYLLPVSSKIDALERKIAQAVAHKEGITKQMKETSAIIQLKYNRLQWKPKILEAYELVSSSTL